MPMPREKFGSRKTFMRRFYAAASYVGFDGSSDSVAFSSKFPNGVSFVFSKLPYKVALLLKASYLQATIGPCNVPVPVKGSSYQKRIQWRRWKLLGKMPSSEAMRFFLILLEEEYPGWYSRISSFTPEPVADLIIGRYDRLMQQAVESGNSFPQTKEILAGNCRLPEGFGALIVYDEWVAPPVYGPCPRTRYEHGAAVIDDKMYIFGGYCNGTYLSDLQTLDLKTWTWSKVEVTAGSEASPCAGHSLIAWEGNKLLSVGGLMGKYYYPSESMQVKVFDLRTSCWSTLKTYGRPPVSRGGHSVTLVGPSLVIFGGEDAKGSLLNDLHILDLKTMTWDEIDTLGVAPSPRSDHVAAEHAKRYLLIFGGGSYTACFNDLHVLDLQTMEWSKPEQQMESQGMCYHAGVADGDKWFIVGVNNKSGASQTVVLNMSTLVWSVVTTVQGRVTLASEGLSLVLSSHNGEGILISFGGYNWWYGNEVMVFKPSCESTLPCQMMVTQVPDCVFAWHNAGKATCQTGQEARMTNFRLKTRPVVNEAKPLQHHLRWSSRSI